MRLINKDGNNYFALKKEDMTKSEKSDTQKIKVNEVKSTPIDEELMFEVREFVKTQDVIFASRIQANFTIGYPKAVRIVEQLVAEGVVEKLKEGGYRVIKK